MCEAGPQSGPADPENLRQSSDRNGYLKSRGVAKHSFSVLMLIHLSRLKMEPALSLVPDALAPPKGWCPTVAPVVLSLM